MARLLLLLLVAVLLFASMSAGGAATVTVDVRDYGATGNGVDDDTEALMTAWKAACGSAGAVTMLLSPGTYYIGPVQFHGPCNASALTFQLQGTLKADTDLSRFRNDWWIQFGWVTGLTVAGGGVFDGQGAASWPFNQCPFRKDCKVLPTSVRFVHIRNTAVRDVTSVNPKFFHMAVLQARGVQMSGLRMSAPAGSPNTDGIHVEHSAGVSITDAVIGTGDDCVSVGHGSDGVDVARVRCGPGHGMSVGSLGRYPGERDVARVRVRDVVFVGTDNGVRIKTWENSPSKSSAAHMLFQDLLMVRVRNPIVIDQTYCPYYNCEHKYVSGVTLEDIQFKNIRGTTTTPVAVTLRCGVPCRGLVLQDVDLKYVGEGATSAECENATAKYVGYQFPKPCT